jgi:hypothetical protein
MRQGQQSEVLAMFKFTIREAVLITTIVAVSLMWWMERNQNSKNEARLAASDVRLKANETRLAAIELRLQFTPLPPIPPRRPSPGMPGLTAAPPNSN